MERHPLHDKYPELHKSDDVTKSTQRSAELEGHKPVSQPAEKLEIWMDTLEKIHIGRDPKVAERIKTIYHKQHVMRPDQVPESYFEQQRRIAREQGHGDIDIPDQVRAEMATTITRDQERSLDSWIDYLSSADAAYPMWFKYYTFRNITRLADFDKEKGEFPKRSKSTTSIFPDINREALAYMADSLAAHYGIKDRMAEGEPSQLDPTTKQLLDSDANFAKLYKHAIEKSQPAHAESLDVVDGQWVRYDQGSSGAELAATLQGYGTGWCTAGEGTAQMQLDAGDFYVYYSKDTQGEYKVPRVAIRMEQGKVAEVRGIEANQNLEGDLVEIAEAKLADLPGAEAYKQKAEDMRRLTKIEHQLRDDPAASLSDADLRFLYELDRKIQGFGYERDPRIDEILLDRDKRLDLAHLLNLDPSQVSLNSSEAQNADIKYHYGDLNLYNLTSVEGLKLPDSIGGGLNLSGLTSAEGLILPDYIGGYLSLYSLTSAEGLKLPDSIGGGLYLDNLTPAERDSLRTKRPDLRIYWRYLAWMNYQDMLLWSDYGKKRQSAAYSSKKSWYRDALLYS